MNEFTVKPVAYIRTDFKEKFGIPRQSGRAPSLTAEIVFAEEYRCPDALRGIEEFSHLWLIFDFSKAHREEFSPTVRPPRLGGNTRVGVFASRSPFRPNPIGLSCVKLLRVEERKNEGLVLIVSGADLLDGTPVLDIKPYLPFADCIADAKGGYASEHEHDKLQVDFPERLLSLIVENKRQGLTECLADDPRPSYQDDPARVYGMRFGEYEIKFTVQNGVLTVSEVRTDNLLSRTYKSPP
ncbi:MAG: tRNA (N6-threonylcarbamoyladenosine(37)-N6)-methyltransferase TrmO [Clostridia bacterium]|nr:tRNA (N6-threonylcarbamoyladenosine(37)-N6)-methyltransferase TrmO [Clostridia bacterium]